MTAPHIETLGDLRRATADMPDGVRAWAAVEIVRCARHNTEYRLSRARAAAHYYRRAALHFANHSGSGADVDEVAATAAARNGDDLTAADLRREAGPAQ